MNNDLISLLDQYWEAAYAEGKEGREGDTPDAIAQRTLSAIVDLFESTRAETIKRCAIICEAYATTVIDKDNKTAWSASHECAERIRSLLEEKGEK